MWHKVEWINKNLLSIGYFYFRDIDKCHVWRHKSIIFSISFLGVFFPTSPFIFLFYWFLWCLTWHIPLPPILFKISKYCTSLTNENYCPCCKKCWWCSLLSWPTCMCKYLPDYMNIIIILNYFCYTNEYKYILVLLII